MRQHWELGQALRQRYHGFLNTSYHRQEVRLGAQEARGMEPAVLTLCPQGAWGTLASLHAFLVTPTGQDIQELCRTVLEAKLPLLDLEKAKRIKHSSSDLRAWQSLF